MERPRHPKVRRGCRPAHWEQCVIRSAAISECLSTVTRASVRSWRSSILLATAWPLSGGEDGTERGPTGTSIASGRMLCSSDSEEVGGVCVDDAHMNFRMARAQQCSLKQVFACVNDLLRAAGDCRPAAVTYKRQGKGSSCQHSKSRKQARQRRCHERREKRGRR